MKNYKYYLSSLLMILLFLASCQKSNFTDTSFVRSGTPANAVSALFTITQDNTGLVTITPSGTGIASYKVYYGDTGNLSAIIAVGKSIQHVYKEGNYQVKIVGYDLKGDSTSVSQPLVVSYLKPKNLVVKLTTSGLNVSVSATADLATYFQVFYGDSDSYSPIPYTSFMGGQTVSHVYPSAGTYIVNVVALSGGKETTSYTDTIKVGKQISLPVTFEDVNTDYTMTDFGGEASTFAFDPKNPNNHVEKSIKTAGAQTWAGVTIGTTLGFISPVPLTSSNMKMTVMVYSPAAGLDIKLKLDNHTNPNNGLSVETDNKTTVANQWETLTFDFSNPAIGTPAYNPSNVYDLASLFFDFGNAGTGSTFYFDSLAMAPVKAALTQINLPVSFEDPTIDYSVTDFGGDSSLLAKDPTNAANTVLKTIRKAGSLSYAGTTFGTGGLGFSSPIPISSSNSKMKVMVYSPSVGIDVKLKIEDHTNGTNSVETDVKTTVANQWETLIFDFNNPAANTPALNNGFTYDKATIFYDFGDAGSTTNAVYYCDSLQMASAGSGGPILKQINLPVTFEDPTVDYTMTDFGGDSTVLTTNPAPDATNSSNHVMESFRTVGALSYAGTTIGTSRGFATAIPLTATRTKMTVDVFSPAVGIDIKFKVENHNDPTQSVETDVKTTVANKWETLTFDFSNQAPGTAALNPSYTFDKASIFFDFGNVGDTNAYYWDNVNLL